MKEAAFAFRGYDITNIGRSQELLEHPRYSEHVETLLAEVSAIHERATGEAIDLVDRVGRGADVGLDAYSEAIALVVAMELAHLRILDQCFGISLTDAALVTGYSLGEVSAVIASGVFEIEEALTPLLRLAGDTADLAHDVSMGVLFSRGPALDEREVQRRCLQITGEGRGTIAISSYLSPNTMLLIGQADTVARFKQTLGDHFPRHVHLRPNAHRWPPIHTPITRQKNIPDRAAVMLETVSGGFQAPSLPVLSCVTGGDDYDDLNARELLNSWVDHPQRLWDVVTELLHRGIQTLIHVGPAPNIIPATFSRLANNVTSQMSGKSLASLGLRAVSRIIRRSRPWLDAILTTDATIVRAPFVTHVVLEDWLLDDQTSSGQGEESRARESDDDAPAEQPDESVVETG